MARTQELVRLPPKDVVRTRTAQMGMMIGRMTRVFTRLREKALMRVKRAGVWMCGYCALRNKKRGLTASAMRADGSLWIICDEDFVGVPGDAGHVLEF